MTTLLLLGIVFGLLGSAFYSGLETGVVSVNPLRLKHMIRKKVKNADILQEFIEHPDHLLGTALVGNNLCNVIASISAISLGTLLAGRAGYTAAYIAMTILMLIMGEYVPKAYFQGNPAVRVLPFIKALKINGYVYYPISRLVTFIARILLPLPRQAEGNVAPLLTREELHHLTEATRQAGAITKNEGRLVKKVFELNHKTCADLMIPLADTLTSDIDTPALKVIQLSTERNLSRIPIYDPNIDRFVGIVYIFDILSDPEWTQKTARDFLRAPQFVRDKTPADEILARMRQSRQPMALVENTNSRVIGIITTEDVLKAIVGPM